MNSLLGILNAKAIWASDTSSLNDRSEIVHANDVIEHALENKFHSIGIIDNVWFHSIALQIRSITALFGHCVASFCEENDQLSLWRPYASDGRGASIGFVASALSSISEKQGFELKKVIYDRDVQYATCMSYLDDLFTRYKINEKVSGLSNDIMTDIRAFVNSVGIFFKHPSFADEREWRLISSDIHLYDKKWQFRASDNMIIPYTILDLKELFDNSPAVIGQAVSMRPPFIITLGPRVRLSPTSQAIQAITHSILGKGYAVSLSASPYQG